MGSSRRERELDRADDAAVLSEQEARRQQDYAWELARPEREEAERIRVKEAERIRAEEIERGRIARERIEQQRLADETKRAADTHAAFEAARAHIGQLLHEAALESKPHLVDWARMADDPGFNRGLGRSMMVNQLPYITYLTNWVEATTDGTFREVGAGHIQGAIKSATAKLPDTQDNFLNGYSCFLAGIELEKEGDTEAVAVAWDGKTYYQMLAYVEGAMGAVLGRISDIEKAKKKLAQLNEEARKRDEEARLRDEAKERLNQKIAEIKRRG